MLSQTASIIYIIMITTRILKIQQSRFDWER